MLAKNVVKKTKPKKMLKTNISTSISYEEIGIAVKRQTKEFEDFLRVHYVGWHSTTETLLSLNTG